VSVPFFAFFCQLLLQTMKFLLAGKFRVDAKMANGSVTEAFSGTDIYLKEQVTVKVESVHTHAPVLLYESRAFKLLRDGVGIPKVHWYGDDGCFNILVIDNPGPTIQDLNESLDQFGQAFLLAFAKQVLDCIEFMHSKEFIHRNVKPEIFSLGKDLLGKGGLNVHIMDLSLAKRYRYPKTKQHIAMRRKTNFKCLSQFSSHRARQGLQESRRDDLEAIGNMMVYLQYGELPANFLCKDINPEVDRLASQEMWLSELPTAFIPYLKYAQSLQFDQKPDYDMAWSLLHAAIIERNHR